MPEEVLSDEIKALVERLQRGCEIGNDSRGNSEWLITPDHVDAARTITEQAAEIERLRVQLAEAVGLVKAMAESYGMTPHIQAFLAAQ